MPDIQKPNKFAEFSEQQKKTRINTVPFTENPQKAKYPVGRPPKYKTPAELQIKVDEYFADNEENPTLSGLALHLDFADYRSILEYEGTRHENRVLGGYKKEFAHIISRARLKVLNYLEKAVMRDKGSPQGGIHRLKVMKYDAPQQISGIDGQPIQVQVVDGYAIKKSNPTNNAHTAP